MKKTILLALLLVNSTLANAGFMDGNKLNNLVQAEARHEQKSGKMADAMNTAMLFGYVLAVADYSVSKGFVCPQAGVTESQLIHVFKKSLAASPERWNEAGDRLVQDSLQKAFPCKK